MSKPIQGDDATLARLEDATFLADHGVGLTEAAHRFGISRSALDKWLRDHDRQLLARLQHQDYDIAGRRAS